MNGSFLIARKSFESNLWRLRPASWWKIWCYIVGSVQHTNYKELLRGQGYFNFRELIRHQVLGSDVSYSVIDHFMRYAKSAKMLATTKATHGVLITVRNYDKYQTISNYKSDTLSEEVSEVKAKQKRNESDNINKYVNNDKYVSRDKSLDKTQTTSYKKNVSSITLLEQLKTNVNLLTELNNKFPAFNQQQILEESEKCVDWIRSKGKTQKDYLAFFRNWLRKNQPQETKGGLYAIPRG